MWKLFESLISTLVESKILTLFEKCIDTSNMLFLHVYNTVFYNNSRNRCHPVEIQFKCIKINSYVVNLI